jgi:hypothetical protein
LYSKRFQAKHATGLDPVVDTGSREENASNQESGAQLPIHRKLKSSGIGRLKTKLQDFENYKCRYRNAAR